MEGRISSSSSSSPHGQNVVIQEVQESFLFRLLHSVVIHKVLCLQIIHTREEEVEADTEGTDSDGVPVNSWP